MAPRFPFTELCKTATLGMIIGRVESGRPIDYRDILSAVEICIEQHMNTKFVYLFQRYLEPFLSHQVIHKMQNRADY